MGVALRSMNCELKVSDIHTYLGKSHILQGISLEVSEGEIVALLGRNGMGKTTLIRSVMNFAHPNHGSILFENREITRLHPFHIARLGVGLVPQGRSIFFSLTTEENLVIGKQTLRQGQWTLDRVLSIFPQLGSRLQNLAANLSGGEQQMLAIGRMLMGNPKIALMDEPSEGLSPLLVWELGRVINELKTQQVSILLAEQNVNFAASLSDYVYLINNGAIVYESEPEAFEENDTVKIRYLGI
jgi:branched-chain amino acid transport system ATP-binding protein